MLAFTLLTTLALAAPTQGSGRTPVPSDVAIARRLPLTELLDQVPDDAWRPNRGRWTLSPATLELRRRAESGDLSDDDWRTALVHADTIHTRKRWPAGQPLVLWVDEQAWLRSTQIRVRAVQPDLGEVSVNNLPLGGSRPVGVCGNAEYEKWSMHRHLRLAALPSGTKCVRIEVTILQGDPPDGGSAMKPAPRRLWQGLLELPVEAVSTVEEALPSTKEGGDAIRKALVACLTKKTEVEEDEPKPDLEKGLGFVLIGDYDDFPVLRGTGLALSLELWHEGRSISVANLVADRGDICHPDRAKGFHGQAFASDTPEDLRKPDVDLSTWTVRVRGNPGEALSIWEADRWWNGEFTVPLSDLVSK